MTEKHCICEEMRSARIERMDWQARYDELVAMLRDVIDGIDAVRALMNDSTGVSGLHLNGDIAPWHELEEGGRFKDWLTPFNYAEGVADEYRVRPLAKIEAKETP